MARLSILGLDTMVKKSLFLTFLFMMFVGVNLPTPAFAGYDGDTMEVQVLENSFSLFPRNFYTVEFFNNPQESESKFTMRLASYGEVTGCAEMTPSHFEKKQVRDTIKLEVTDSQLSIYGQGPRYSNYDCDIGKHRSFFDVELDRDDLIKKGIKHIALKSTTYGEFMRSDIDINEHRLALTARTAKSTSLVTFWFFPKDAVVLHAPNAKHGQRVQDLIRKFALSQGLVPLEDTFDDFELPWNADNYAFFTNPSMHIVEQLSEIGENTEVGYISPMRTVFGKDGPVEEP